VVTVDRGAGNVKATAVIVFDHINGVVLEIGGDSTSDPKLADRLQPQPGVITTASGVPSSP
jgi:hypothetical protein